MIPERNISELSVLNCGAGDIKVSFDPAKPEEVERAKQMVEDMMQRGYSIFVEVEGKLKPVKKFNKKNGTYIVGEKGAEQEVPASEAKATAVPRSAGG